MRQAAGRKVSVFAQPGPGMDVKARYAPHQPLRLWVQLRKVLTGRGADNRQYGSEVSFRDIRLDVKARTFFRVVSQTISP